MTYLAINLLTILVPLLRSFESRVRMVSKWKALMPAIAIVGLVFVAWDVAFTRMGIWGFSDEHLVGLSFFGLPIEEIMFFFTVPYACLFIYEVLNYFIKKDVFADSAPLVFLAISVSLTVLGVVYGDNWYTSVTFLATASWTGFLIWRNPPWLGRFLLSFLVALVPFLLVNGVLTGTGLENPVVWYNDSENLGIRLGTIPIEDSVYALLLLSANVYFYELFASILILSKPKERPAHN